MCKKKYVMLKWCKDKKDAREYLLTTFLGQVHIEFTDGEDKITVEGPPEEVEEAKTSLEELTKELVRIIILPSALWCTLYI